MGEKTYLQENSPSTGGDGKFYIVFLSCFATIGGLLFGYDTGIVSGSLLLISDYFNLSTIWKESIVSATVGAAALFALVAGVLTDLLGRKKVIMMASFVFTGGAVVMAIANSPTILLVGRLIVGVGIGFASMSVPVYVSETSPTHIRGALVTVNQLFITIGILLSSIIAGAFSGDKVNGWRYMLGLAGVPSIVQFIGFFWLPESPRWLLSKGREEEAEQALMKIRQSTNVTVELSEIKDALDAENADGKPKTLSILAKMLRTQPVRRALLVGCILQCFQQLCGINTVIYYSGSILRMAGFPSQQAIWLVCVPNAANLLCTFIGIYLVEKLGRKILLIGSFIGVIIALTVLGVGFELSIIHTPSINVTEGPKNDSICFSFMKCQDCISAKNDECGFCYVSSTPETSGSCLPTFAEHPERYAAPVHNLTFRCDETNYHAAKPSYVWADSFCPTKYSWMAILGLALFVIGFAPGLGPMPWTINSEIYPNWARSTGSSIATSVNWIINLAVSMTFLSLVEGIGSFGTFYMYGGISLVGLILVIILLPETKGKSLEDIEELFMSKDFKQTNSENVVSFNAADGSLNKGFEKST